MPSNHGNERRNNIYRFHTLLELLDHFSEFLSAQQMEAVVRDAAKVFVERHWASEPETRLQFVKKCEYIMEALVTLKETASGQGRA